MANMLKEKEALKAIAELRSKKSVKVTIQAVFPVEHLDLETLLEEMRSYGSAEITDFSILESEIE